MTPSGFARHHLSHHEPSLLREDLPETLAADAPGGCGVAGGGDLSRSGAVALNDDLQAGDQGAYLQLALDQKEGRALTDGNRHPLYSALLIPLAERKVAFFSRARWVDFRLGVGFSAGHPVGRMEGGTSPVFGLLRVGLPWPTQPDVSDPVRGIWCEPLLYLLVYLLWWGLDRCGDQSGNPTPRSETTERPVRAKHGSLPAWVGMGAVAGLAYLTKGTGLQVAALFYLTAFVLIKDRKKILFSIATFLVVIAPLLVWNIRTYQDPLYSFASTHNMWFDEADEIWYNDPSTLPTLGSYLHTHSGGQILTRAARGIALETRMAGELLWSAWTPPLENTSPGASRCFVLFKVFFCAMVLWGIRTRFRAGRNDANRLERGLVVLHSVRHCLLFDLGWSCRLPDAPVSS